MPIFPLPQFEADLEADRKLYEEKLKAPKSIVVRFGTLKFIGEYPYDGDAKPGCGSKLVCRTHRGTELTEMLTSTCPNAGCDHAVTRKDMLGYIENSGGQDYPFFTDGRVLRVATVDDLNKQAALDSSKTELLKEARQLNDKLGLGMKLVEAEPILGGEKITYYYASEERIDFRPLVMELAAIRHCRIEMKQVGARDEARITADYEKCGQHCCCKQFLKVLKPVSMRNAKIQKATLDPLKISGRCGRLMCCLRYEEASYDELRANLPKKKTRVLTPDGPGLVMDTQILTQLALVLLDNSDEQAAYPVESLKKYEGPAPQPAGEDDDAPPSPAGPAAQAPGAQAPGAQAPGTQNPGSAGANITRRDNRQPGNQPGGGNRDNRDNRGGDRGQNPQGQAPRRDGGGGGGGGGNQPGNRGGEPRRDNRDGRGNEPRRDGRPDNRNEPRGDRPQGNQPGNQPNNRNDGNRGGGGGGGGGRPQGGGPNNANNPGGNQPRPRGQQPGGQFRGRPPSNNPSAGPNTNPGEQPEQGQPNQPNQQNPQGPRQPMSPQERDRMRKMIPPSDFAPNAGPTPGPAPAQGAQNQNPSPPAPPAQQSPPPAADGPQS